MFCRYLLLNLLFSFIIDPLQFQLKKIGGPSKCQISVHLTLNFFIYLILGCAGSLLAHGLFLVAVSRAEALVAVHGFLADAEHGL